MKNAYTLGLTIGALWLTVVGTVFGAWSLIKIGTPATKAILVILFAVAAGMVATGVLVMMRLRRSPGGFGRSTPEGQAIGRRIRRQFAWAVTAEVVGCGIVSSWCIFERRFDWIAPLNIIVVGLHFFPLARIFLVPRYNVMGLFFCAIPLMTLLAIPDGTRLGSGLAYFVVPGLGCGIVAILTAGASFREALRFVSQTARPI